MPHVKRQVFDALKGSGVIKPFAEPQVPQVPKDFATLKKMGVVRGQPANMVFFTSYINNANYPARHLPIRH